MLLFKHTSKIFLCLSFVSLTEIALVSALVLSLSFVQYALALPGDLDLTFSGNGIVEEDFSDGFAFPSFPTASAMVIQSDGKIVVAGVTTNDDNIVISRYNSNGALDTSFGIRGIVTIDPVIDSNFQAIAIQVDGKILVAGNTLGVNPDFLVERYNSNGTPDTSFGNVGRVTTDFEGRSDIAFAIAIQIDGRILVAGQSAPSGPGALNFALTRYNSNGTLDTTFSGDGKLTTDFSSTADEASAITVQPDGKILVAGVSRANAIEDFALARYNSSGTLDTTFSGDGKLTTDFFRIGENALAIAIQPDNKILVAGYSSVDLDVGPGQSSIGESDFALARYNSNGTLDITFSGDGRVTTSIAVEVEDFATAIAIQLDNRILVAGGSHFFDEFGEENSRIVLARYIPNGSLDTTFSGDGLVLTDLNSETNPTIAIQKNDGRIVLAGISSDFVLARLHAFDCNGSNVTILGTQFSNTINGTSGNDIVHALGGRDSINGNDGSDILCGGDGNDTINGGSGDDTLLGQNNDDFLDGGSGTDACSLGGASVPPTAVQSSINCETGVTSGAGISGVWLGDVTQTCNESDEDLICTLEGVIEVENPGTETAPVSSLRFFLSFDEFLDEEDTLLDETQVDLLDPKEMEEVSLLGIVPPGEDAIGQFIIALLDAEDVVLEVREDNNVVVSSAIVGEGSDGGVSSSGCSIARSSTPTSIPLYLLIPVFIVIRRLWKGYRIN